MIKLEINLKTNHFDFTFTLKRKFAIVSASSGIGKSLFVVEVSALIKKNSYYNIVTSADDGFNIYNVLVNKDSTKLFILDEEHINSAKIDLNKVNGRFILLTRKSIEQFCCSYKDFYAFKIDGRKVEFRRKYPDLDRWVDSPVYQCENSKSGYYYFKLWTKSEVLPGSGNTELKNGDYCIIADGSNIGHVFERLYRTRKQKFFLPESFEYIVVQSYAPKSLDTWLGEQPDRYVSLEKWLDTCVSNIIGFKYSKGYLHPYIAARKLIPELPVDSVNWNTYFELFDVDVLRTKMYKDILKERLIEYCYTNNIKPGTIYRFIDSLGTDFVKYSCDEVLQLFEQSQSKN